MLFLRIIASQKSYRYFQVPLSCVGPGKRIIYSWFQVPRHARSRVEGSCLEKALGFNCSGVFASYITWAQGERRSTCNACRHRLPMDCYRHSLPQPPFNTCKAYQHLTALALESYFRSCFMTIRFGGIMLGYSEKGLPLVWYSLMILRCCTYTCEFSLTLQA